MYQYTRQVFEDECNALAALASDEYRFENDTLSFEKWNVNPGIDGRPIQMRFRLIFDQVYCVPKVYVCAHRLGK